jgi:long-chain acyl-CoA synthetase
MESKKMIKSPLFHQATGEWNIMVVLQTERKTYPYTLQSPKMIMNILNQEQYIVLYLMQKYFKSKFNKSSLPQRSFFLIPIEGCKTGRNYSLASTSNQTDVETSKSLVKPNDLANNIYTSGTTGRPKELCSHDNIVSDVLNSAPRIHLKLGKPALSFLPVCHILKE